jgi:ABC-2 type transport system permease protein
LGIASTVVSNLPSGFLALALLYFLLGYLTYASLMGALGALAPSAKETGQFMLLIMSPLLLTTVMMPAIAENPDGVLAMVFSLFPLTSSASMMSRLAAASVPPWQILLSLGLLILSTYGFLALAARFFRADTLLSTMSLNWKRVRSILTSAR